MTHLQLTSTCTFDSLNSAYHLTLVPITNVVAHYGAISHKNRHNSEQSFLPSSSFESSLVKHFLIMLNTAE